VEDSEAQQPVSTVPARIYCQRQQHRQVLAFLWMNVCWTPDCRVC